MYGIILIISVHYGKEVPNLSTNKYINKVLEQITIKHHEKPEYIQAVTELFSTLANYINENPQIEKHNILELIAEPERVIQFRVPWEDDHGNWRVNLGWRIQYNSAIGPYKGGIRFHPTVNESMLRFLGFEQTFKNGLTGLPIGGGKGGSDFNPKNKSDREIMRFTQSFMTELQKYIGPDLDVPAGDMGVSHREIGYMYGQYKRLNQPEAGVITGKPIELWGSFGRTEATGYGLIYFTEEALKDRSESLAGKKIVISGMGSVGIYAAEKAIQLGAQVIAMSDSQGYLHDETGLSIKCLKKLAKESDDELKNYADLYNTASYYAQASVWSAQFNYDIAFPCATQNEIDETLAKNLINNCGIQAIFEGANMPNTAAAIKIYKNNHILFGPGKAANAGGVAVSALEMAQNSQREQWTTDEVDRQLKKIMSDIYTLCSNTAQQYAKRNDLEAGANIAGFARVAEAMITQGLV